MPAVPNLQPLVPSLLDRLMDDEPEARQESASGRSQTFRELKEGLRRDLEALLNTRHGRRDLWEANSELAVSTLTYGLPDFTGWTETNSEMCRALAILVKQMLQRFEPRLTQLDVQIQGPSDESRHQLRITIQGVLTVKPFQEDVVYNSTIDSPLSFCEVRVD
jgi:type VI secretion system protein ImpF